MEQYKVIKEMSEKQQIEYDKARANPDMPESIRLFDRARSAGYIQPIDEKPDVSEAESLITGASVGGSLGATRPVLSLAGMATGMSPSESWKKSGEFISESKKQNPKSYLGGMAASLMAPGGAVSMLTKAGKTALMEKGLSETLSTLGGSTLPAAMSSGGTALAEGKSMGEIADEMLKGAAMNIAVTGGATLAGEGVKKLLPGLRNIPSDVVDTYSKNRKAVNTLIKQRLEGFVSEIADDIALKVKDIGSRLEQGLQEAANKHVKSVDVSDVISEFENQISNLERVKVTPDVRSAIATLKKGLGNFFEKATVSKADPYLGTITKSKNVPVKFSASDLLRMKRDLQRAAESVYEGQGAGPINEAFAAVAEKATRSLKDQVKGTAEFLAQEQAAIKAKQALGITGIMDSPNSLARVKGLLATLLNPDKIQKGTLEQVRNFDRIYGTNLEEASKLFRAASSLGIGDVISGFRTGARVLAPGAGGALFGPAGFAAGALLQAPPLTRPIITGANVIPGLAGRLGLASDLQNKLPKIKDIRVFRKEGE